MKNYKNGLYLPLAPIMAALLAVGFGVSPAAFGPTGSVGSPGHALGALIGDQSFSGSGGPWLSPLLGPSTASLGGQAFDNARGNIAMNTAAGSHNEQLNAAAFALGGDPEAPVGAAVMQNENGLFAQASGASGAADEVVRSVVDGDAFDDAVGNLGLNVASGQANQQANETAAGRSGNAGAFATVRQMRTNDAFGGGTAGSVQAAIGGSAFQDAVGNVGANVTAGTLDQQSNLTVIGNAIVGQVQTGDDAGSAMSVARARVDGNAFSGAAGNISVNVASGSGQQQANATSLAAGDVKAAGALAQQTGASDFATNGQGGLGASATTAGAALGGDAFSQVAGSVNVNVAAGSGNAQSHAVSLAASDADAVDRVNSEVEQSVNGGLDASGSAAASQVGGFVFRDATGSMGVNVAAGTGNQQATATTILGASALRGEAAGRGVSQSVRAADTSWNATSVNAALNGQAFRNASGNVGLNVASGAGNLQADSFTVVGP